MMWKQYILNGTILQVLNLDLCPGLAKYNAILHMLGRWSHTSVYSRNNVSAHYMRSLELAHISVLRIFKVEQIG